MFVFRKIDKINIQRHDGVIESIADSMQYAWGEPFVSEKTDIHVRPGYVIASRPRSE